MRVDGDDPASLFVLPPALAVLFELFVGAALNVEPGVVVLSTSDVVVVAAEASDVNEVAASASNPAVTVVMMLLPRESILVITCSICRRRST